MWRMTLTGWILIYWGTYGIDTIGYYETETRCNHVASKYLSPGWTGLKKDSVGEAKCIPDSNEEGLPR